MQFISALRFCAFTCSRQADGGRWPLEVRFLSEAFNPGISQAPLPAERLSYRGGHGQLQVSAGAQRLWQTTTLMEFLQLCLLMMGPAVC